MRERSDTLERIRRGYRALGLGANRDVAAMFEDDGDASSALDGDTGSAHDAEGRQEADRGSTGGGTPYGRDGGEWVIFDVINGQPWATRDLVALDLFGGLPSHWDLVGVDVERWHYGPWRRLGGLGPTIDGVTSLVVGGHYRARPRAPECRWHVERVPFLHIWRLAGARVESVYSFLDGIEIRRLPAAA
ncbi:MAG: hypothetical protein EHM52_04070 [Actinomycetota bacterium]|nr:MAG: hypothetical protein EHM52_04070 [Actinomycetota bacterium]